MTKNFELTEKQREAFGLLAQDQRYTLLYGGTRSAKTFTLLRAIIMRAMKAPGSRHLIARYRRNAVFSTVVQQTLPSVLRLCFPGMKVTPRKQDGIWTLPNGSELWFDGLDEADRVEKILGTEFATILFNEASQIPYSTYQTVRLRCAQVIEEEKTGEPLSQRIYIDENPPSKIHWTYSLFFKGVDPDTKRKLVDSHEYAKLQMNPQDNAQNLSKQFMRDLQTASARYRKRFFEGEFSDSDESALWNDEIIDRHRLVEENPPDFQRIVIAVDPSGSGDEEEASNDAIGITAVALGTDGHAYLLEDLTKRCGPATWGKIATSAYERLGADRVVAEVNYGGAMVEYVIRTARPGTPYKAVNATRGKVVRAEPIAALYEQGKVHHVGYFPELEEELCGFTTTGYAGERSPNRADALIWAITELFPAMTKAPKPEKKPMKNYYANVGRDGWMAA